MDKTCKTTYIIVKILIILAVVLLFINLYRKSQESSSNLEGFEQQQDYLKLNETYIEPEGTNLQLLYANYYGEESTQPQDTWQNKTLEQCVDLCNQLEGCSGFSRRANVADTAADECYPRSKIGVCHSARKGDSSQMQNAIKYNSYIKTSSGSIPSSNSNSNAIKRNKNGDILTKCIGDPDMTLQRAVYIKSQMFPNKYIGTLGDGLAMLVDKAASDFDSKCKFRVEIGQDGIGTVSFLHINSNKYLSRMAVSLSSDSSRDNEFIGFKDISNGGTEDKQRASFNIHDAMKNRMKFQCMRVNGENVDKYIVINKDNQNYLLCSEIDSLPTEELYTFNIIDSIIASNIINSKDKIPSTTMPNNIPSTTMPPSTTYPATTMPISNSDESSGKESFFEVDAIGNQITQATNPNVLTANNLDTSNQLPLYNNIYAPPSQVKIADYLSDNYGATQFNNYTTINKKASDIMIQKQLSNSLSKNQETYNALNQLNLEIEREIAGLNMDLNGKNDKVVSNIGRMQLADMAKDYYTLKKAYPLAVE